MVMVDTVYWLPLSRPVAQAGRPGPYISGHLAPCCIHRMNRVNSRMDLPWWQQHYKHYRWYYYYYYWKCSLHYYKLSYIL